MNYLVSGKNFNHFGRGFPFVNLAEYFTILSYCVLKEFKPDLLEVIKNGSNANEID